MLLEHLNFEIVGRTKSVYSIWEKMEKKNIPLDEIYDLFAIRIIIDCDKKVEKELCWKVYSLVTEIRKPHPNRLRDWVSTPKSNGYQSLHTTVMNTGGQWVEVQIRSKEMNKVAEQGFASHWRYKRLKKNERGSRKSCSKNEHNISRTKRRRSKYC